MSQPAPEDLCMVIDDHPVVKMILSSKTKSEQEAMERGKEGRYYRMSLQDVKPAIEVLKKDMVKNVTKHSYRWESSDDNPSN